MSQLPQIPDKISSLLPNSYKADLVNLKKRKASTASTISAASGISEFLDTKVKLLGDDIEIADLYRKGLRQISGTISAKDIAEQEKIISESSESSLKELLVIKRQRKTIAEDMADTISRQKVEEAYAQTLVGKVMAATGNPKKSTFNQTKFRQDVEHYYGASRMNEYGEKQAHCALTGWRLSNGLRAAHLVPKSLSSEELSYLFGVGDAVLSDPRNGVVFHDHFSSIRLTVLIIGILLHKNIEMSLDAGNVVVVPIPTEADKTTKWRLLLTNPKMANLTVFDGLKWKVSQITQIFGSGVDNITQELDGKELTFLNQNRPAKRYLYFRYIITFLNLKDQGGEEATVWTSQAPDTGGAMWATPGPYLRNSMLRVLARQISHNYYPEAALAALADNTTFEKAEGCTTRSAEDEEILGLSLSVRVKADLARSKKRAAKKNDDDEADTDEEEDEETD